MTDEIQKFDEAFVQQYLSLCRPVFAALGLGEEQLAEASTTLQQGAALIRHEAARAIIAKIPFSRAVESEDFPYVRRLHAAIADLLDMAPPPGMTALLRGLRALPSLAEKGDEMSRALALVAVSSVAPIEQTAFARFVLFEWTRLGMLVATYRDRPKLTHLGLGGRDLDEVVEARVQQLMSAVDELTPPEPIRPLRVLFAASLARFDEVIQSARAEVATLGPEIREAYERRGVIEAALESLPPLDEVLVRNATAPALGKQRLNIERLARERPLHFQGRVVDAKTRNTLDKRAGRAQERFKKLALEISADDGPTPRRLHKSLADLFIDGDEP